MPNRNKIPLLENINSDRYDLLDLLDILKHDDRLDSVKILKIKNLLSPVNNTITIKDLEDVLYSMGSDKSFVDGIIEKLKKYDISSQ